MYIFLCLEFSSKLILFYFKSSLTITSKRKIPPIVYSQLVWQSLQASSIICFPGNYRYSSCVCLQLSVWFEDRVMAYSFLYLYYLTFKQRGHKAGWGDKADMEGFGWGSEHIAWNCQSIDIQNRKKNPTNRNWGCLKRMCIWVTDYGSLLDGKADMIKRVAKVMFWRPEVYDFFGRIGRTLDVFFFN